MKTFSLRPNRPGCSVQISGENLVDAVENMFPNVDKYADIGNLAGAAYDRVWMDYSPSIFGGKGGVILHILAHGSDHEINYDAANDPPKETVLWIEAKPEDLPEPYEFEFKEPTENKFDPYDDAAFTTGPQLLGLFCAFVDEIGYKHCQSPAKDDTDITGTIEYCNPSLPRANPELFVSLCLKRLANHRPKADKATAKLMERTHFFSAKLAELENKDCSGYTFTYWATRSWFKRQGKITALAYYRNKIGKTQQAVADEAGISLRQEQAYESVSRSALGDAKYTIVVALAKAVGAEASDLIQSNSARLVNPN